MSERIGIIGVGQTKYSRYHPEMSSPELVWSAVDEALSDAGVTVEDVGAVIAGVAPDALAGENAVEKTATIAPGKPFFRVNTGGTTGSAAVFSGLSYLGSGRADIVLVYALERMGQATTSQQVFNTIFDPIYEKDFPLTTISMAALRATMSMRLYGYTAEHWALIAQRNHRHALNNPLAHIQLDLTVEEIRKSPMLAWPIHRFEACPMSEGACALVLAKESLARDRDAAWVQGFATTSDSYAMGDRIPRHEGSSLVDLLPLELSARRAYRDARVDEPLDELQVIELYSPFSSAEAMTYPALGLCKPEEGPQFVEEHGLDDAFPVFNPSGGPQAANPVGATGMVRIAECALQVRGAAGDRQVDGARRALATGQGGATQFSTVCILGSEPPE